MAPTATLPSAADAATALNSFQRPDSATLLSSAEQKYGVGDLQNRVAALKTLTGNLTSSISAVDPSVTGRTAGTLTTEGQRSALVDRERQPLISDLNTNNQNLSSTTGDLNVAEGNAKDTANAQAKDAEDKYNSLLQTYNIANAREEAQRQAAAAEADRQEKIRQFNESQAQSDRQFAASQASKSSAAAAKAPTKTDVASHIVQQMNTLRGKDGKVSEETWQNALNDWTAVGGTVRDFWKNYGDYVNNKYISTYAGYKNR